MAGIVEEIAEWVKKNGLTRQPPDEDCLCCDRGKFSNGADTGTCGRAGDKVHKSEWCTRFKRKGR